MSDVKTIDSVTPQFLADALQGAGYRVNVSEQNGAVQLLSASQGIGFAVRFGNPASQEGQYLDFTLSCALRVQGELPQGLENRWNIEKRFARLARHGEFLVLEQDVVLAGGVSESYLRVATELWDRLLQEFLLYLRTFASQQGTEPVQAVQQDGDQAAAGQDASAAVQAQQED